MKIRIMILLLCCLMLLSCGEPIDYTRTNRDGEDINFEIVISGYNEVSKFKDGDVICYLYNTARGAGISCLEVSE